MKDKNNELELLKKIKFGLECLINHNTFNFMALHMLGYSSSIEEYFDVLKVKRDLRKIDKKIKQLEKI